MHKYAGASRPLSRRDIEDTALIGLVASGDRMAFQKLYLAHRSRIARFLTRFIQCPEHLEEIIDDTFMTVWRSAGQFRHESRFSTWIAGIGYRTALKAVRGAKYQKVSQDIDELVDASRHHVVDCEQKDWVRKGLDRLPPEQRLILQLAYGLGYSIEEIAAITSSPIGTVKTRMFHAREKLRHHLPALSAPKGRGFSKWAVTGRDQLHCR